MESTDKVERTLGIYTKLMNGALVNKATEAINYGVNERTIQRDIDDIRNYLEQRGVEDGIVNSVIYDRSNKGFRLEQIYKLKFTNPEILAICKILLDSRAFTKKEMEEMLDKLVDTCVPKTNQKLVKKLILNEEFHYIEPRHKSVFIDKMWEIGQAINTKKYIEVEYKRTKDKAVVKRKLKPVAIMFDEMYFYMAAFIDDEEVRKDFNVIDDLSPTIYRLDRIQGLSVLKEKFNIPYKDRFEEGEFRKRIQFMRGGALKKVRFEYSGYSIEAVLDKLPTAEIINERSHEDGVRTIYTIKAEAFGDGIDMWLRSQGKDVVILNDGI